MCCHRLHPTLRSTSLRLCGVIKISCLRHAKSVFQFLKNNIASVVIRVQEYRYADSSWFESWSDIYLKKITVCKPGSPIVTISVDPSIERQWCPIDCIDYFGRKWVEEKTKGQEENKVRLCRFAFYIFQVDKWKEEKTPFYCSEPFRVIITQ